MARSHVTVPVKPIPWWKEPTKDQWHAWVAAWLGWTLDAFDFTIFLLIMLPISQEFHVPLTAVTAVFTITLWMRLVGATGSGWLADRIGRKTPLMISIAWYSACNFIAGFSPAFWFLFLFRALLGIGMGAEWPVGAALAMETWPQRSRGFMAGVLQSSWGLGALLSSAAYGLLYNSIGWRGLLMFGVLPALLIVYVRHFVKEPEVWAREPPAAAHPAARGPRAAAEDLQARHARQHDDRMLVDGERLCRRLFDRHPVSDPSAKGSASEPRPGGVADHAAEHLLLSLRLGLGLGVGPHRPPLGDDPARPAAGSRSRRFTCSPTTTR